jgi:HEAT repeat protein
LRYFIEYFFNNFPGGGDLRQKASDKVIKKIQEQAETLVNLAEQKFKIRLDLSEESLVVADDFITVFFKIHREHYIKATVLIGSYLGEIIRNNIQGTWLKELSMDKVGKLKGVAHPMTRAKKRLSNGTMDSLVQFYRSLKLTTCRDSKFAPDKQKIENYRQILRQNEWDLILLARMLNDMEPQYVREEAAEVLGRLAKENLADPLILAAKDPENVYYASIALQGFPIKAAYEPLMENLKKTDSPTVKQQILMALGKIKEPQGVDEIIDFLADEDEIVGHFAALAIGNIGSPDAVDKLLTIMAGLRPGRREHAITALELLEDNRAVPALIEALFSRDDEIREAAAKALQYIPDERAFKPLAYCLKDNNSRIRVFASYALANIGNSEALAHIKKLLTDEVQNVRLHASHLVKWLEKGEKPQAKVI